MSCFKNEGQEGNTVGIGNCGSGEDIRKGRRRENIMEMSHRHEGKWSNAHCWSYSKGTGEIEENDGGMNLTKIYYKHFCRCYYVPPVQ
jgi:hypothetical protein